MVGESARIGLIGGAPFDRVSFETWCAVNAATCEAQALDSKPGRAWLEPLDLVVVAADDQAAGRSILAGDLPSLQHGASFVGRRVWVWRFTRHAETGTDRTEFRRNGRGSDVPVTQRRALGIWWKVDGDSCETTVEVKDDAGGVRERAKSHDTASG